MPVDYLPKTPQNLHSSVPPNATLSFPQAIKLRQRIQSTTREATPIVT